MLKERREAALQVADKLFAAEDAIDAALTRVAELNAAMLAARSEARLSALVGQHAFEAAAGAYAALALGRRKIVETHKQLGETKIDLGLGAVAIGDGTLKPRAEGEARRLQAV